MTDDPVVERSFTVDGQEVVCRFFRPEPEDGSFFCRYTIDWSKKTRGRRVYGVDGVQALLLAMQAAHVDLLIVRKDEGANVMWLDERSLGLPLARGLRDLDPDGCFYDPDGYF